MLEHFYQHIEGWFNFGPFYSRMVEEAPSPAHFVEVGAWYGRSTAFLAVEIANSGKRITLDVVDTWKGNKDEPWMIQEAERVDLFASFWQYMKWGKVDHLINPIQRESVEAARGYLKDSLDFVFIDGCHTFDEVSADITAWSPKIKKGGIIAGDDFDPLTDPGVCIAVTELVKGFQVDGRIWWRRM